MTPFSPKLTDSELLVLVRSKSTQGAELLYDLYAKALLLVIIRIVPERNVAEEILRQTFLEAWNSSHLFFPEKEKLLSWMIGIARNLAVSYVPYKVITISA